MSDGMEKFDKPLSKYTEGRRFDDDTILMLRSLIDFRLDGWSFKSIGTHLGVTRSRINNLEKSFIKSLTKKQQTKYNGLVKEGKKERRNIG